MSLAENADIYAFKFDSNRFAKHLDRMRKASDVCPGHEWHPTVLHEQKVLQCKHCGYWVV